MRLFGWLPVILILCSGCHSIATRKQEHPAEYAALPISERQLVDHGQIERGMDTNAVYIAWGKPSAVTSQPARDSSAGEQTWIYYGNRPVLVPGWTYLPDPYGYWTLQYDPRHHSERYRKAEVTFHDGRVVDWKTY